MCILFIYTNPHPEKGGYRLIVASNRDEFYRRPSKEVFLCNESRIIGGRDMEKGREGGMWLGASVKDATHDRKIFCVGALLNLTGEEKKSGVEGRGFVVTDYLKREESLEEYLDSLKKIQHNAFNFVSVEVSDEDITTTHYSNVGQLKNTYSGGQILGFGNSTVKNPLTKVQNGWKKFEEIISKNLPKDQLVTELIVLLKCPDRHLPDPELEKRAPDYYEWLSSIFVSFKDGGYGSRTHSVILLDHDWNIEFIEHTMKEPIELDNPQWNITHIKSNL